MSDEQVTDPANWARQISSTVRFADELDVVLTDPARVLVEVGPGGSLTGSAMRHPKWSSGHRAVRLMRHPIQNTDDRDTFLLGLGQLWAAGVQVNWAPSSRTKQQIVSFPVIPLPANGIGLTRSRSPGPTTRSPKNTALPGLSTNGGHLDGAINGQSQTEGTLRQIWLRCLGVSSLDRNDNFFNLGGDSLISIAISTASTTRVWTSVRRISTHIRLWSPWQPTSIRSMRPAAWRNRLTRRLIRPFRRTSRPSSNKVCKRPVAGGRR